LSGPGGSGSPGASKEGPGAEDAKDASALHDRRGPSKPALTLSQRRLAALVRASSDVLYAMSPDWREMRRLLGNGFLADTTRPNRDWLRDYIHPDDQAEVLSVIGRAIAAKRVFEYEHRVVRADGSVGWTMSRAVPLLDEAGEITEWFGSATDVTERKWAEEALRESEQRYRALVEGMPQLVWRADPSGTWTWAGPQWAAFTGQASAESLGEGWLEAVHPEDRGTARAAWDAARRSGLLEGDWRLRRAEDGAWRWFQTRALTVRDPDGQVVEWLGTSTDINDQMEARDVLERAGARLEEMVAERTAELMAAEESLRQAQKMEAVGRLTGGIAHDFNNMLQGVAGSVEMARRRVAAGRGAEAERYLEAAREAVERAASLTRRLLTFARRQRLEPKPVDADGLVAGMAELVRRAVGPGITVDLRLREGDGVVLCDPTELESALLNLCINARDAMTDGGRLTVCTEDMDLAPADIAAGEDCAPGRYIALSVADTGAGMPPEVAERVFEPFFTTKPVGQGTGLGLSQVWGFARQSGGTVRIDSAPGRGTTVRLLLPWRDPAETSAAGREPDPPASREASLADRSAATVLLVDDEAAVRGPAGDRLRELGHTVLEAADGAAALQLLASARPDLLVTDVGLPGGMNGRQVAEAARDMMPGLPVLFITGYAVVALPPGVEVIGKPFELEAFVQRVQGLLSSAGR